MKPNTTPDDGYPNLVNQKEETVRDFYHVTKVSKLYDITKSGLAPSMGISAQGMSADSGEAYKYAEQDKNLIYMWTDLDYTERFKKSGQVYALIIVRVDEGFVKEHMRPTKSEKGTPIPEDTDECSTAVCDFNIELRHLYYYPHHGAEERPLAEWGKFNIAKDVNDKDIWGGEE